MTSSWRPAWPTVPWSWRTGRSSPTVRPAEVVCHSPIFAPQVAKVLAPEEWLTVDEVRRRSRSLSRHDRLRPRRPPGEAPPSTPAVRFGSRLDLPAAS